jgi:hypothetical protein
MRADGSVSGKRRKVVSEDLSHIDVNNVLPAKEVRSRKQTQRLVDDEEWRKEYFPLVAQDVHSQEFEAFVESTSMDGELNSDASSQPDPIESDGDYEPGAKKSRKAKKHRSEYGDSDSDAEGSKKKHRKMKNLLVHDDISYVSDVSDAISNISGFSDISYITRGFSENRDISERVNHIDRRGSDGAHRTQSVHGTTAQRDVRALKIGDSEEEIKKERRKKTKYEKSVREPGVSKSKSRKSTNKTRMGGDGGGEEPVQFGAYAESVASDVGEKKRKSKHKRRDAEEARSDDERAMAKLKRRKKNGIDADGRVSVKSKRATGDREDSVVKPRKVV